FDSWAGALSEADYREYVQPHSATVMDSIARVPRIHFGVGTSEFLGAMRRAWADVIGIDWRLTLSEAFRRVSGTPVQGNLDPAVLGADWPVVQAEVHRVIEEGRAAPGHVFNLGHGVMPSTDPDVLHRIVETVHSVDAPG